MLPALHVQIIQTRWTKVSRGGEAAGQRNGVPLALPIEKRGLRRGVLSAEVFLFGEPKFEENRWKKSRLDLDAGVRFEWGAFSLAWDGMGKTL